MFSNRKPALRHFAVIERASRSMWGSIWLVQDRRNLLRKQYLFVPSRLRAWPMWLKHLEIHPVAPARLRNGRVALLISDDELASVVKTVKSNNTSNKAHLDALRGFQESKAKGKKLPYWVLAASAMSLVVLFFPRTESEPVSVKPSVNAEVVRDLCSKDLELGAVVEGSSKKLSKVEVEGIEYKIADVKRFGGLAQLKLKRLCDSKYFRVDAWASGNQLLIEKIY